MTKLEERIDSMIFFIFDIKDTINYASTENLEAIPKLEHQKIVNDLYICESLVDVL